MLTFTITIEPGGTNDANTFVKVAENHESPRPPSQDSRGTQTPFRDDHTTELGREPFPSSTHEDMRTSVDSEVYDEGELDSWIEEVSLPSSQSDNEFECEESLQEEQSCKETGGENKNFKDITFLPNREVESLLWHHPTNASLNTCQPLHAVVPGLTKEDILEETVILLEREYEQVTYLIVPMSIVNEKFEFSSGAVSAQVGGLLKKLSGYRLKFSAYVGIPEWTRCKIFDALELFERIGFDTRFTTVLSRTDLGLITPFNPTVPQGLTVNHHTVTAFIIANLGSIFPDWIVSKYGGNFSEALRKKRGDVSRILKAPDGKPPLPSTHNSLEEWIRNEYCKWVFLLTSPRKIKVTPGTLVDSTDSRNFKVNLQLLLNENVKLTVFV